MDKKWTQYEETHNKLVEAMQQASMSDASGDYKSPEIDLSFLNYPVPETKKRSKLSFSNFGRVAAVLIIVLLGLNLVLVSTDSIDSYGEKGLLHRIQVGINGIFTDQEEERLSTDVVESFVISDFGKIDLAKEFLPELYVPEYMPDGYVFEQLEIEKYASGDCEAEYQYLHQGKNVEIICYYSGDTHNSVYAHDNSEVYNLSDRIISIYQDSTNNSYVADIYTEECLICIKEITDKNELVEMSRNLQL